MRGMAPSKLESGSQRKKEMAKNWLKRRLDLWAEEQPNIKPPDADTDQARTPPLSLSLSLPRSLPFSAALTNTHTGSRGMGRH